MNPITKFWSLVESQPDSLALVSPRVQMNYRDLAENVARFAGALRKAGVAKGNVVAIQLQPELEAVFILAVIQLGAVSLSASKLNLENYFESIDYLITTNGSLPSKVKRSIVVDQEFMEKLGSVAKVTQPEEISENDLVRLSFSSGTTGIPKAIPFSASRIALRTESSHRNWMQVTPGMSLLGLDTITGIISLFWAVTSGLAYYVSTSAAENLELVKKFAIKSLDTSPARLKDLLEAAKSPQHTDLEQIWIAGSLMAGALGDECERIFGITPSYLYGSTEVGAASTGLFERTESNRVGKLVSDVELEIVDNNLNVLLNGDLGHIRYRKTGMPGEYWHSGSNPQKGFVDDWFYPGDDGWLSAEGYLYLAGRNDDLVNTAGNKFNLLALDTWLSETSLFEDVASFSYEESGETRVGVAFVSKHPPEPQLLVEKLQSFLPNLQLGQIIRMTSIPRNNMDKVDRMTILAVAEGSNA